MAYEYHFDQTSAGNLRFSRPSYEVVQAAFRLLYDELVVWNVRAMEHGATRAPYQAEVDDLAQIIAWGNETLGRPTSQVVVTGMSVGSCRYAKAALLLWIRRRKDELKDKAQRGWPQAVQSSLEDEIIRAEKIANELAYEPNDLLWELIPRLGDQIALPHDSSVEWDAFISHASEDKDNFVRPLAEGLQREGLKVWFDEFSLTVGDSLRRSIDRGLAHSKFGVVVISSRFLEKEWPQKELDALVSREADGIKTILPVWHNISAEEVRMRSPLLADRVATTSVRGLDYVIADLLRAISAGRNKL
jgi:hypothetical protein